MYVKRNSLVFRLLRSIDGLRERPSPTIIVVEEVSFGQKPVKQPGTPHVVDK